ncbi:tripartite tricarboxylate transporter TctB family protein [Devosia algicola]|uniref:Tripartite tricarboxylate transporter TctB family protein n=1 Tax=Devosia algicola TaxID=3026418 RepID=A0ABY7YNJ5_9HYPH|nr:tripartite tricarboxylate transporter TctB family protein [Devosia algicola]WDR02894.1 tripartite tricarboxylate transporter TctB family protein [Devosia algicola]
MNPTQMDKLDFVSSLVLTIFGVGVLVESLRLPRLEHLKVNPFTVPGIVPGVLGLLLAICGLAILVRSIRRGGWRLGLTGQNTASWARSGPVQRSAVTLVLTLGYALVLFPQVPFRFSTPLFVFAFIVTAEAMALGRWPKWQALVTGLVLAILAGLAIGYVFQEPVLCPTSGRVRTCCLACAMKSCATSAFQINAKWPLNLATRGLKLPRSRWLPIPFRSAINSC